MRPSFWLAAVAVRRLGTAAAARLHETRKRFRLPPAAMDAYIVFTAVHDDDSSHVVSRSVYNGGGRMPARIIRI